MSGFRSLIAAFIAALCCSQTYALNVLVQTTARSASGEPVGVVEQVVNLRTQKVLPGAIKLPGAVAYHPTRYTGPPAYGVVTVGPPTEGSMNALRTRTILATFRPSPLSTIPNELLARPRGWRIMNALVIEDNSTSSGMLVILERSERPGERAGRVSVLRGDFAAGEFPSDQSSSWDLAGIPVDACVLADGVTLVVLCEDTGGTMSFLHVRNIDTGEIIFEVLELRLGEGQFGSTPIGITKSPGASHVVAITSGYQILQSSGDRASWVHVVDTDTFSEREPPLTLPGSARLAEDPLQAGNGDSLWILTRSTGSGFAYLSHLNLSGTAPEFLAHVPFSGVHRALKIATAPSGPAVVVAADERLELWQDGKTESATRAFTAPIGAILWSPDGILVGEGGRIHQLDPETLNPRRSVQLQTGHVTEIHLLGESESDDRDGDGLSAAEERSLGTTDRSPDSDGDGIPDGVDPEPTVVSPRLELPSSVILRGEAAGREVLTFPVGDRQSEPVTVRYDRGTMRWLGVSTGLSSFEGPRLALTLDPARYPSTEDEWMSGILTVHKKGTRPGVHAAGSPARLVVDVVPSTGGVRKILWVWSERDDAQSLRSPASAQRFSELAELLAGPPNHYSHQGVWGPFEKPIEPYDTIFITMEAAAEGALTRHVILDYVAHGGSLLLVAGHGSTDTYRAIERWLEPAAITLEVDTEVSGVFSGAGTHAVVRNWNGFSIRDGCTIRTGDNVTVAVRGRQEENTAILALRPFGFGRIAVLASGTPLENGMIRNRSQARFAQDLFRWLVSGRYTIHDQDADGIPDYLEDTNGNGIADAGETDLFNPDSDADGIPDGAEDPNGNGTVDEGETNPRNADSDNDGIDDAADAFPLPLPGMPQIASLDPRSGPAEGGTVVEFTGLNFPPNASVWFGEQLSERIDRINSTRLIAVSPPAIAGELEIPVTVRIASASTEREAILPSGFQYTARGRVALALDLLRVARRQYQTYTGAMAVVMDSPDVKVGRIAFNVRVSPVGAIERVRAIASPALRAARRRLSVTHVSPSEFRIAMSRGLPLSGRTILGTLQWTTAQGSVQSNIQFEISAPIVLAQMGGRTSVDTHMITVQLPRRTSSRASPR